MRVECSGDTYFYYGLDVQSETAVVYGGGETGPVTSGVSATPGRDNEVHQVIGMKLNADAIIGTGEVPRADRAFEDAAAINMDADAHSVSTSGVDLGQIGRAH